MLKTVCVLVCLFLTPLLSYDAVPIIERASRAVVFVATRSEQTWSADHSHGSGVIISPEGHIVTAAHVVKNVTKVLVVMRGKEETKVLRASVIGKDRRTDLAVLKIEDDLTEPLSVLRFGDSTQVKVGEEIICIGHPLSSQLELTVTTGVISGVDRNNFRYLPIEGFLQTDAAINSGNSGSPLINASGEVLGLVDWGFSHFMGFEGLSFAIPSHTISRITRQIIDKGEVSQGFLGVRLENNEESAFDVYYFNYNEGASIKEVIKDSPAEKAGLKKGDLIQKADGLRLRSSKSLRNHIAILPPGTKVQLTVNRNGAILDISLTLGSEELSSLYSNLEGPIII